MEKAMKVSKKQADQIIRLCLAANAALKAGIELPRKENESTESNNFAIAAKSELSERAEVGSSHKRINSPQ